MGKGDDDFRPLSEAAELAGVNRNTLGRWVKAGKLVTRDGMVRNLKTTMVSVAEVRRLVGDGLKAGRPPADGSGTARPKGAKA